MVRARGYFVDRHDPRDRRFEDLPFGYADPPESAFALREIADRFAPVSQGMAPACVGYSIATALRLRWAAALVETGGRRVSEIGPAVVPLPSALWIWWQARQVTGRERYSEGTYIRDAFKRIAALGVPRDETLPASGCAWDFAEKPADAAFRESWDMRARSTSPVVAYHRITSYGVERERQIKIAIANRLPVVFGGPVDVPYTRARGTLPIPAPDASQSIGGHAQCAAWYDRSSVGIVGSWGGEYGDRGCVNVSWRYAREWSDIWIVSAPPPPTFAKGGA